MSIEKVIGGLVSIIMLLIFTPVLISMLHSINQQPALTPDNTAIEQAKNLSIELDVCKKQVENLSNTIVTKNDLLGIENVLTRINQNTITVYEQNNKFISNYFTFTISIAIALTFSVVIGAFSLFDAVFFNMDLTKGFFRRIKKRFTKNDKPPIL